MGCEAPLAGKCLFTPGSVTGDFDTDLVLLCDHGSLVGLYVQDYKSLCALVTICVNLANKQTHRKHFDQLI